MAHPDTRSSATYDERREKELRDELAKANAVLDRDDILNLQVASVVSALATRNAIEWMFAEIERRKEQAAAERERKRLEAEDRARVEVEREAAEQQRKQEEARRRFEDLMRETRKRLGLPEPSGGEKQD